MPFWDDDAETDETETNVTQQDSGIALSRSHVGLPDPERHRLHFSEDKQ
jgi:hypothetical protein